MSEKDPYFQEQEKIKEIAGGICNFLFENHSNITLSQAKEVLHKVELMLDHSVTLQGNQK